MGMKIRDLPGISQFDLQQDNERAAFCDLKVTLAELEDIPGQSEDEKSDRLTDALAAWVAQNPNALRQGDVLRVALGYVDKIVQTVEIQRVPD